MAIQNACIVALLLGGQNRNRIEKKQKQKATPAQNLLKTHDLNPKHFLQALNPIGHISCLQQCRCIFRAIEVQSSEKLILSGALS